MKYHITIQVCIYPTSYSSTFLTNYSYVYSYYLSIQLSISIDHLIIYLFVVFFFFISNCVGIGNRRLFWSVLIFTSLFLSVFFISSKYTHHYHYCQNEINLHIIPFALKSYIIYWIKSPFLMQCVDFFDGFFGRELCVFQKYPGFYGLSCVSFLFGFYLAALLQV